MKTYVIDMEKIAQVLAREFPLDDWKSAGGYYPDGFSNGILDALGELEYTLESDIAKAAHRAARLEAKKNKSTLV